MGLQESPLPDEVIGLLYHGRDVENVVDVYVGGLQLWEVGGVGQRSKVRVQTPHVSKCVEV